MFLFALMFCVRVWAFGPKNSLGCCRSGNIIFVWMIDILLILQDVCFCDILWSLELDLFDANKKSITAQKGLLNR